MLPLATNLSVAEQAITILANTAGAIFVAACVSLAIFHFAIDMLGPRATLAMATITHLAVANAASHLTGSPTSLLFVAGMATYVFTASLAAATDHPN